MDTEPVTQQRTVTLVVAFLGVFLLLSLAGLVWLVHDGKPSESVLVIATPMGTALGALAAILVSTRGAPPAANPGPVAIEPPTHVVVGAQPPAGG